MTLSSDLFRRTKKILTGVLATVALASAIPSSGCATAASTEQIKPVKIERKIENDVNYKKSLERIVNHNGEQAFNDMEVHFLWSNEVPVKYAQELARLSNDENEPFYDCNDIVRLEKTDVSLDYIKSLTEIKDDQGKSFFTSNDIAHLWSMAPILRNLDYVRPVPVDYLKQIIKIKDTKGKRVFFNKCKHKLPLISNSGGSLIQKYYWLGGDLEYTKKMAELSNPEGEPLFDGCSIYESLGELPVNYTISLSNILNSKGKPLFPDGHSIVAFVKFGGTLEKAKAFAEMEESLSPKSIVTYAFLGLTPEDGLFQDTEKPNALMIYPSNDWNSSFRGSGTKHFFKKIQAVYDVQVRTVAQENEVYDLLENLPNIELLVLGGHGTQTTLSLGEEDLAKGKKTKDETYTIDTSDKEMGKYLSLLNPEAVIFLNSCSNAEGGKGAKNLANFVAEMALGRKVIASEKDFQISGVKVEGMYPLNLSIFYGDLEVTFDSKKEGEF